MDKTSEYCVFIPHTFSPLEGGAERYLFDICDNMKDTNLIVFAPLYKEMAEKCYAFDKKQSMEIVRIDIKRSRFRLLKVLKDMYFSFRSKYSSHLLKNFFRFSRMLLLTLAYTSISSWVSATLEEIVKKLKNEKIDIIHNGYILPSGLAAYILNCFWGIPYIVYTYAMELFIWEEDFVTNILLKDMLKNASCVVTISQFTKQKLEAFGVDKEKIVILNPIVNIPRLLAANSVSCDELRKRYNIENKKILLTISHLVERKGQDMIIKSLPKILEEHPNTIYLIGGRGKREKYLRELVYKLKLENNVIFIGLVPDEEISSHYQLCDIFVMTSRQIGNDVEGFGIVYLEAGYWEKPVIAGRSGGVEDAVIDNETGFLVNPESPEEIAMAINKLLADEELNRKLGKAGKENVLRKFNYNIGSKVEEINNEILK